MIQVNDKFVCTELMRDGNGPCWDNDGTCGYPLVEIGETGRIIRTDKHQYTLEVGYRSISVNEEKLAKFFTKDEGNILKFPTPKNRQ